MCFHYRDLILIKCSDPWWADHVRKCGGDWKKTREPDNYKDKKKKYNGNKRKKNDESANKSKSQENFSYLCVCSRGEGEEKEAQGRE